MAEEKLFDNWFDPIETELRTKVRGFIEAMIEAELATALARPRYGRRLGLPVEDGTAAPIAGHRHGRRTRSLTGTFGRTEIAVPRARIIDELGYVPFTAIGSELLFEVFSQRYERVPGGHQQLAIRRMDFGVRFGTAHGRLLDPSPIMFTSWK